MIKDIKYSGFTAAPSDYESPDGDLAAVIGLVPDVGHLKPIVPPKELFSLAGGMSVRFIHETTSIRNYIVFDPSDNSLSYTADGDTITSLRDFDDATIHAINAVGNTLVVLASDGMHYFLWKPAVTGTPAAYKYLGSHIPECPISFGLQCDIVRSMEGDDDVDFAINFYDIPVDDIKKEFSEQNKTYITDIVLAKVNKFIAEEVTGKGRFVYPFFVRYAYRLYDGSLTMHSSPVLMVASTDLAPQVFITELRQEDDKYIWANARVVGALHQLDYACLAATQHLSRIREWSDIVKSVDVFVSAPIYTYDQNGVCKRFLFTSENDGYAICLHRNQDVRLDDEGETFYAPKLYQKNEFGSMYGYTYPKTKDGVLKPSYPEWRVELPMRSRDAVYEDIKSCSTFYYLSSINLDALATERTIIPIKDDYLQSLVTREVMTDDYDSHDTLIPKYAYGYNSRLNVAGITKTLFDGFNSWMLFSHTNGYAYKFPRIGIDLGSETVTVKVFIRQDGKEIVVENETALYGRSTPWLYFYYPNINAYKAQISQTQGFTFEIPLEPHTMLNGAVFFGGWDGASELATEYGTVTDAHVNLLNKIYTSEVNNPFFFPLLGITTVGVGEIIGIRSAAKALSQGQFGQFPLYAFTTDGVWALEVSSTGSYSARQPITQDVCINDDSITQLDSSVLFATSRGIMLLSGSTSVCITDSIDYVREFSLASLPCADEIAALAGFSASDFSYVPFRTFVAGCRIIYAYTKQRIIIYNPLYPYSYVYSLETKAWGMMKSYIKEGVPSYPEALATLADGTLVDFCDEEVPVHEEGEVPHYGIKAVLVTRPIALDAPDTLKTVNTVIQRGDFRKGSVKSALYASRDLRSWELVWTSNDHYLRGFRGTPYKYFRIMLACEMEPDESIYGATVQYEPRLTNNPR